MQRLLLLLLKVVVAPWCSGYYYCTTSFNKAWTQVLHRFKSCSQHVRDLQWWWSLTVVLAGNKAKCLLSVNHTTKIIHHLSIGSHDDCSTKLYGSHKCCCDGQWPFIGHYFKCWYMHENIFKKSRNCCK